MATFCAALAWGLGVSLGGTVGLLVFILAKGWLDFTFGHRSSAERRIEDVNKDSLIALERRNELTVETIQALERIAKAVGERGTAT